MLIIRIHKQASYIEEGLARNRERERQKEKEKEKRRQKEKKQN